MLISRLVIRITLGFMMLGAGMVSSQDYPNKPLRLVAPAAGGGGDYISRMIAQGISGPLGQQVIVENRSGVTQQETVSKAPPDGYTLLVGGGSTWVGPLLRKTPFDVKDFAPITLVERSPNVLVVHPSMPIKSVKELIALAKARPGELNYGSAGIAGGVHLACELFKSMAGVNIVHVPYKGSGPAISALIGGEVQLTITDLSSVAPHMKSGKLKAVAVTSLEPSALTPGLPTVAATGLPGYEAVSTTGLFAPARTPVAIISKLNQEVTRFLNLPGVKERFLNVGVEIVSSSPEEFGAKVQSEIVRLGKVIKDAGIRAE